ncbi:MAG: bifunctional phosphopantothenoylcysteine decarboxylase/phosphopantothenate--cysteine ligase CoaBC, partial [Phaeodactylibacter sp.]|nr:bifunctional phosphopantothenoylcysteine decarboxylase/phosphopantothenate--cysteine ligase CoaBC [Phaeodactylibacter sp.]
MGPLHEKKIILAVCGSIAAYKAALLTRLLIKAGADVQVLMTDAATGFVSTLTFSTLSKRPVFTSVHSEHGWNNHVDLGLWADAFLIAPATATTLGKLAHGIADNMVVATYLSARCPVFFAPAMDLDMWQHPSTQANVQRLQSYGDTLIPVEHGELASGLVGPGRMAEPEAIVEFLAASLAADQPLAGYRVMITAGPTYEPIDPVRFIGNHSSGKMGLAIAEDLAARGAQVDLILGPSVLEVSHPNIRVHRVKTGQKMFEQAKAVFPKAQIAVFAAAVADYRPKVVAEEKIKKQSDQLTIELEKTIDIAATLGKLKGPDQVSVGFALETEHPEAYAQSKLERKNFDLIVLNSLRDAGAGFQYDTNKITIF